MWPLSRRSGHVIRLCRDCVELWARTPDGLVVVAHHALASPPSPAALEHSLVALLRDEQVAERTANAAFDVVLESAWMPVLPLEAGSALWSASQMKALLEHRLAQIYAGENETVNTWVHRLDYQPGDGHGIGYAFAPNVNDVLIQVASLGKYRWSSLQPAFSWGWDEFAALRRRGMRSAAWICWVWHERDRAIVAMARKGRIVSLNPGASLPCDEAALARLAAIEAVRWGADDGNVCVLAAGWQTEMKGAAGNAAAISPAAAASMGSLA